MTYLDGDAPLLLRTPEWLEGWASEHGGGEMEDGHEDGEAGDHGDSGHSRLNVSPELWQLAGLWLRGGVS